jgi:hypothetical protein
MYIYYIPIIIQAFDSGRVELCSNRIYIYTGIDSIDPRIRLFGLQSYFDAYEGIFCSGMYVV